MEPLCKSKRTKQDRQRWPHRPDVHLRYSRSKGAMRTGNQRTEEKMRHRKKL